MKEIFEDTATAFALKTDSELERAYFLFKLIANEPLVKIGTAVTNFAIKAHLPVEKLIRASVFDHFCGGVNEEECLVVAEKMFEKGVSTILDYSVEGQEVENQLDSCYEKALKKIDQTLGTLYTIIVVAFILSIVMIIAVTNSIKKPLTAFQEGLLEFFKYINRETSDAKLIEVQSSDVLSDCTQTNSGTF